MSAAPALSSFEVAADALRQREFTRLAAAVVPTVDALRLLNGQQLRVRVAAMLERLGHELLTPETAADFVTMKDGNKYVVAFASPNELAPTPLGQLSRLHSVVVAANAVAGYFITPRGFTLDAEAYAATAPLKLVDGPKLVASITRSMAGVTLPDSYQAMCRQCGEIVQHRLDHAEAIPCRNGHPVAPTIARAALVMPKQEGGSTSSRTYTPPRRYSRQEVRAHNAKYQARMRKRKPRTAAPSPDHLPELGLENDGGEF
ncbi:MAG TPA: restriction endonuclease [Xanthobacteraceae bacterium]|nr:restriction endonuclease [Xanthobacteraceae bacterium]